MRFRYSKDNPLSYCVQQNHIEIGVFLQHSQLSVFLLWKEGVNMASKTSVRQMLNDKGIDNNRIGWSNGTVTVDNQNFMKPTNVYQGTSYADQPAFNQAFSTYQNSLQPQQTQAPQQTQQPYQLAPQFTPQAQPSQQVQPSQQAPQSPYQGDIFTPAETDMTWQQRIPYYAQNPEAGQAELQRAQQALGVYTAMGDTQRAQEAQNWIGMLGNVVGQPLSPQDAQIKGWIENIMNQMNNLEQFDPYSSPAYEAAQAQSQRAGQQATRAAQESLGSAGFGRSTRLTDRAQRIQNDQNEYLMTQVIPQIIAQNEAKKQLEMQNRLALLNPLMTQQRTLDERERFAKEFDYTKERDITGDVQFQQEFDYKKARDAIEDENYKLEFDEDVRRWGIEYATDKAYKQGQLDISRYNAQTSRMGEERIGAGQNLDNLYRQWESTKVAPEGIPGVAAGTPFPENGVNTNIDEYDLDIINQLANDQGIDYSTATDADIRSFVARLKFKESWSIQEAKEVEDYMLQNARNAQAQTKQEEETKKKQEEEKLKKKLEEGILGPDFGKSL